MKDNSSFPGIFFLAISVDWQFFKNHYLINRGVAVDDQGYIVVADSGNNRIQVFTAEGVFVKVFGCWGSGDGEFKVN